MARPIGTIIALVTSVMIVAGCSTTGGVPHPTGSGPTASIPFDDCPAPLDGQTAPPPRSGATLVPDVSLPCFTGTGPVALRGLAKPAVINLWASWCGPCRDELPAFEAVYQAAGDRLAMLGVDSKDTKPGAQSLAEDLGITMPSVFDPEGKALKGVGQTALPITLFVDASGELTFVYVGVALTVPALRQLIETHLGVTVEL